MTSAAGGLNDLHRLHVELREVREQLRRGPAQVKAREQIVQRKRGELEEKRAQYMQLRMRADDKSLQLKTKEARLADLRTKLNMASSNREYDVIRSQLDADTMANSVLEDEILEALEKVDGTHADIARLEAELASAQKDVERVKGEVAAADPGLRTRATELESAVKRAETAVPGTVMETYKRLVQRHGADALAPVENKACTACYAILSPQEQVNVNSGKPIFCRSCGRLLYQSGE
ncbi:MAG: hypothetical protein KY476_14480 [Planctomycetes bacterium]|nr:hypothetical protein [Planctomycetota bacterium]